MGFKERQTHTTQDRLARREKETGGRLVHDPQKFFASKGHSQSVLVLLWPMVLQDHYTIHSPLKGRIRVFVQRQEEHPKKLSTNYVGLETEAQPRVNKR